jgi:K319L-like, PKD domain
MVMLLLPSVLFSELIAKINSLDSFVKSSKVMQPVIAQQPPSSENTQQPPSSENTQQPPSSENTQQPPSSENTQNKKPIAVAGPDQTVKSGDRVNLDGTESYDPDCENGNGKCAKGLKYSWERTDSGPGIPELESDILKSKASFTAPSVDETTELTIDLYVEDNIGDYGKDGVAITVEPITEDGQQSGQDQLPIADAGQDQTVRIGQEVHLDGIRSHPEGAIKSIEWKQTGGPHVQLSEAGTLEPIFSAPSVEKSKKLTFELVVYGNAGPSKPDSVTVRVEPTGAHGQQPPPDQPPHNSDITFNAILSKIKDPLPFLKQNDISRLLPLVGLGVAAIVGATAYGKYKSKKSQHKGGNVEVITRGGIE